MRFVGNLILNTSCEFDHDDVTTVINIIYGDVAHLRWKLLLFGFCGQKDLTLMPFTLRCIQYMVTSVAFEKNSNTYLV